MGTNLLKKYRKHFALVFFFWLNLYINFTPNGISISMKETFAQVEGEWQTGNTWINDLLNNFDDYQPGIYVNDGSNNFSYCPNCAYQINLAEVVVYGTKPSNTPIDLSISDLWNSTPLNNSPRWRYWDYGGGGWSGVVPNIPVPASCTCCGNSPCTCQMCRCCGQKTCFCNCPKISFTSGVYTISGTHVSYVLWENYGLTTGGVNYVGYLSTNSSGFTCTASMKIYNCNLDANFYGKVQYYEDYNMSGELFLNNNVGNVIYNSFFTYVGTCNGSYQRKPCNIGELKVTLSYNFYETFSNYIETGFSQTYAVTQIN